MLRRIRDSLPPPFGGPSVFAPDKTKILQRVTHSCRHCKGLDFAPDEVEIPLPETSNITFRYPDLILYNVLRLACTTDCPLFKSFFKPDALTEPRDWKFAPDGKYKDEYKPLCFSVMLHPSHQAPSETNPEPPELFVKFPSVRYDPFDRQWFKIGDLVRDGPPSYLLFHARGESSHSNTTMRPLPQAGMLISAIRVWHLCSWRRQELYVLVSQNSPIELWKSASFRRGQEQT